MFKFKFRCFLFIKTTIKEFHSEINQLGPGFVKLQSFCSAVIRIYDAIANDSIVTIQKPASFFIAISHLRYVWCITVVVNRITEYKTKLDFILSHHSCTHWLPLAPINFNYISFSTNSPSYCLYVFEMSDCVLFIFNCVVCLQIHVKFIIYSFFILSGTLSHAIV